MSENSIGLNVYYDEETMRVMAAEGRHRDIIGGLWDEVGTLQFEFLKTHGLAHTDILIDIGCGCLRGGVHFIDYLNAGNYHGIDLSTALLDAGYDVEVAGLGLQAKLPRSNLLTDGHFGFDRFGRQFDVALAQSVFTHLPLNHIRLCLHRLAAAMRPGGRLFATFFEAPEHHAIDQPLDHPNGVRTFSYQDPFHYRISELEAICQEMPWRITFAGDWSHPRDQKMVVFERIADVLATEPVPLPSVRQLPADAAAGLPPGADHYRAYVGPPDRFDFMSATQFSLLFALGLRDHNSVLDFGCGSLRLGRLLISYLQAGRYYGIDPNRWLIEDGLARELGWSAARLKAPSFAYNEDFRCDLFGRRFDFIVAQSIITHCGPDLSRLLLTGMAKVLEPSGKIIFSIIEASGVEQENAAEGWLYPGCVGYRRETILQWCAEAGLIGQRLPWYHPGAVWYMAAADQSALPTLNQLPVLSGSVLFDPQFVRSQPAALTDERPANPLTRYTGACIDLNVTVNGAPMGSEISGATEAGVTVEVTGTAPIMVVQVIKDWQVVHEEIPHPSGMFDTSRYLATYADVASASPGNDEFAYSHYKRHGFSEGRQRFAMGQPIGNMVRNVRFDWTDPDFVEGAPASYVIRIVQDDGSLAISSSVRVNSPA